MDSTVQEKIVNILKEKFEGEILSVETPYNFLTINLKKDKIIDIIQHLYQHSEGQIQYLTTLCGIHSPAVSQIAVIYQLHSLVSNWKVGLKVFLSADDPVSPSLTTVFSAAHWMERETFDF